ncbi:dethiobiotin synthase [Planctellipticum variicoloris]|uniref:dethiobiotin synthase n=1 Tax=Planctellipticum variicoloris TaxID=3064265 RepID=UPI003013E8B9|nr:dethiobiotin synthase [Planctomycetaceae bacterium SH412]
MAALKLFPCRGLFVTGTDTGVGKTVATTLILRDLCSRGLRVGAYKPACSGAATGPDGVPTWDDVSALRNAIAFDGPDDAICPQRFLAAVAPPQAARLERREVNDALLTAGAAWWCGRSDVLVVEGAGGWLSPLSDQSLVADVAAALQYPVLVVARAGLGTINHTLLTIESVRARGLRVAGIVLNEPDANSHDLSTAENAAQIERFGGVGVLGRILFGRSDQLVSAGPVASVDWQSLADGPRAAV